MKGTCIGFQMADAAEAWRHMKFEIVKDYGDYAYGHPLYTWDDGKRMLARCKSCSGLILIQNSEFHSFTDSGDSYYTDYFPVGSYEEADELNRRYDGFEIESEFPERYLCMTNCRVHWS